MGRPIKNLIEISLDELLQEANIKVPERYSKNTAEESTDKINLSRATHPRYIATHYSGPISDVSNILPEVERVFPNLERVHEDGATDLESTPYFTEPVYFENLGRGIFSLETANLQNQQRPHRAIFQKASDGSYKFLAGTPEINYNHS